MTTCVSCLFFSGCAVSGPSISREELEPAQEYYRVKSRRHLYGQTLRVRTVGERLLQSVPPEQRPAEAKIYLGILLDELDRISWRAFSPDSEVDPEAKEACIIVGVIPDSPAERAGLQAGDLLLAVDGRETPNPHKVTEAIRRVQPDSTITLSVERGGAVFENPLRVGSKAYPVSFQVVDAQEVNAFAAPGQIVVTSGLLRFIESDDELAVVMAHELAHLTLGHLAKGLAPGILAGAVETAALPVEIVLPGAGGFFGRAARAPFSKDFERQADEAGLRYAHWAGYRTEAALEFWDRFAVELPSSQSQSFFNTHPASPERLLRMKRVIEEIRSEE